MSDAAPLPDLHQSELDEATLRQLFDDVRAHTELMEVIPKHAAAAYVPEIAAITLAEGLDLLLVGGVRALQLRYRHDGTIWWDTLMPTPHGTFKIVRIQHDFPEDTSTAMKTKSRLYRCLPPLPLLQRRKSGSRSRLLACGTAEQWITPTIDIRTRYEFGDVDGSDSSHAWTFRERLGLKTMVMERLQRSHRGRVLPSRRR